MPRRIVAVLLALCLCILMLTAASIDMVNGSYSWDAGSPEAAYVTEAGSALGLVKAAKLNSGCTAAEEQQIWNTLLDLTGNSYGAAGIMGNLYAESGLSSTNMENSYEASLGYNDATYTAAVDAGTYTNFIHDSVGYGLAQFTWWTLKRDVYEYAQDNGVSVGDITAQLEVLKMQIRNNHDLFEVLQNAQSVREASNIFLHKYENPRDQSAQVEALRASYGQHYYEKYELGYAGSTEKTNVGLVQWALTAYTEGWGYVAGTYGKYMTEGLLAAKAAQYPDLVGIYEQYIREHYIGIRTADCIGLIKGYSWYDADTGEIGYATNKMPDIGADQIYDVATVKGPISTMPEIPGLILHAPGHVGIYIGDGYVVEATGTRNGVVMSRIEDKNWTGWCRNPYISYVSDTVSISE